ncbi:hypothetical protein CHARACLAT_005924 [Characodon lateralis]|uniref:Uncharacterized protein n=1 Tax=Characodon lateralis TaxID=208331 RepID=A0ABU7ESG1_9TELE|nr:hypothetical protein [Characodon lateralis]
MLEILLEPPTTNLDFSLDHFAWQPLLCTLQSYRVRPAHSPTRPSGSSDHIAFLRSRTAPDSHLSSPGRIHPHLNCELSPLNCFFFLTLVTTHRLPFPFQPDLRPRHSDRIL